MAPSERSWTDQQVEELMGNLLRTGVIIAAAVVLIGGIMYLLRYGFLIPEYHSFRGEPTDLRSVSGVVTDALLLRSRGLIQFGLLLLIATPVVRVAFAFFAFARQRDRIYIFVALIVLALLIFSLVGGNL